MSDIAQAARQTRTDLIESVSAKKASREGLDKVVMQLCQDLSDGLTETSEEERVTLTKVMGLFSGGVDSSNEDFADDTNSLDAFITPRVQEAYEKDTACKAVIMRTVANIAADPSTAEAGHVLIGQAIAAMILNDTKAIAAVAVKKSATIAIEAREKLVATGLSKALELAIAVKRIDDCSRAIIDTQQTLLRRTIPREVERLEAIDEYCGWQAKMSSIHVAIDANEDTLDSAMVEQEALMAKQTEPESAESRKNATAVSSLTLKIDALTAKITELKKRLDGARGTRPNQTSPTKPAVFKWEAFANARADRDHVKMLTAVRTFLGTLGPDFALVRRAGQRMCLDWDNDLGKYWQGQWDIPVGSSLYTKWREEREARSLQNLEGVSLDLPSLVKHVAAASFINTRNARRSMPQSSTRMRPEVSFVQPPSGSLLLSVFIAALKQSCLRRKTRTIGASV